MQYSSVCFKAEVSCWSDRFGTLFNSTRAGQIAEVEHNHGRQDFAGNTDITVYIYISALVQAVMYGESSPDFGREILVNDT